MSIVAHFRRRGRIQINKRLKRRRCVTGARQLMAMLVLASAGQVAQAPALGVARRRGKLPRRAGLPSGLHGRRTRLLTSLQPSSRLAAMSFE